MAESVLESFLVRLGFQVDGDSEAKFKTSVENAGKNAAKIAAGVAGMAAAIGAATLKAAGDIEKMWFITSKSGTSMTGVKALAQTFEDMGGSAEQALGIINGLYQKMERSPLFAQQVEAMTGAEVIDKATGKVKSLDKVVLALRDHWADMASQGEAQRALALHQAEAWGISQDAFDAMMRPEFAEAMKKNSERLAEMGINLDENAKTAHRLEQSWRDFKKVLDVGSSDLLLKAADLLNVAGALDTLTGAMQGNFRWLEEKIAGLVDSVKALWREITKPFSESGRAEIADGVKSWWDSLPSNPVDAVKGVLSGLIGKPAAPKPEGRPKDQGALPAYGGSRLARALAPGQKGVNNPFNIKRGGKVKDYDDPYVGLAWGLWQSARHVNAGETIAEYARTWAQNDEDGQAHPEAYAGQIVRELRAAGYDVTKDSRMNSQDPNMMAALARAQIQLEHGKKWKNFFSQEELVRAASQLQGYKGAFGRDNGGRRADREVIQNMINVNIDRVTATVPETRQIIADAQRQQRNALAFGTAAPG